ncbi:hypothetical protein CPY53_24150 [Paenibacillus polymyxa]|uniref:hypothetical protein n=1 Tax=Paenibacillus polymyxa TaxID=1406 RepID=UPI001F597472|nr:hypothetical protein [Paenibacillus polymyxa]UNL96453.1 hypothetical protein CPY53_24150 [Paenibacillus polymyxa]
MNDKKIVSIGIDYNQRLKNNKGKECVPCEVSERYILFDDLVHENGMVFAQVRTTNDDVDRLLCGLTIKYDDLVAAIENMKRS